MEAKRKNEVWEVVNRERRKTRRLNENIDKREKWENYFRGL